MRGKDHIIEVEMSRLDLYIIDKVRELRESKSISQDNLSVLMGFSEKLIGSIENPTLGAKYNIRHLNLLAQALECSLWDLLPQKPLEEDLVKVKIKRSKKLNKDGTKSKRTLIEIIEIKPIKRK